MPRRTVVPLRSVLIRAGLLSAFALFMGIGAHSAPAAAQQRPAALDRIAPIMEEFVRRGEAAGIVTLVMHEGRVVHEAAVGLADVENKVPMKTDALFSIASMTKPMAAAALMVLVDDGKVALDDPVAKHLPEFAAVKLKSGEAPQNVMTLRHLLTHTSGLGGSQENMGTLRETARKLAERPLDFEPGTKWQYSPGLSVAGAVVEVVSGQPFEDFLAEKFFVPLGMKDTSFLPPEKDHARVARLYQPGDTPGSLKPATSWINDLSPGRTPNPSGGLFSTAADVARFYQMILNGGTYDGKRILTEKAVAELTRVQTGDLTTGFTPGNGWGLGFCIVREPQAATEALSSGSFGHGGAFGTQSWADPASKTVYILMVQRTNFGNADGSEMRRTFQAQAAAALRKP